jgi:hypothetical protein
MIENKDQYVIAKRKLNELNEQIENIVEDTSRDPLRNKLILASLKTTKKEIEKEIFIYSKMAQA